VSGTVEDIVESLSHPAALRIPCILLLLAERDSHGYELEERLKDFGFPSVGTARMYRELRQLADAGLVRSVWEVSQLRGPARRTYELTRSGAEALAACADAAGTLGRILGDYSKRSRAVERRRAPVRIRSGGRRLPVSGPPFVVGGGRSERPR
jgi:DNA-binding PadR family transcriptional regulator